jgi:hypothetical protein
MKYHGMIEVNEARGMIEVNEIDCLKMIEVYL